MCSDKYPNLEHKTNKHIYSVWKYNRKSVLDKFPTFNLHVVLQENLQTEDLTNAERFQFVLLIWHVHN